MPTVLIVGACSRLSVMLAGAWVEFGAICDRAAERIEEAALVMHETKAADEAPRSGCPNPYNQIGQRRYRRRHR